MGLNENINNLKNAVETQATTINTKGMQKYKIENSLLIKLEYYINRYIKNNKDVYHCDIQDEIIQKAIVSEFGEEKDVKQMTASEFVENYTLKEEKRDRDYYYIYCMRHYLQCCRNVNNYIKNKKSNEGDYKKQIALEKWELQRQKMQLQIEREKQKLDIQAQKSNLKQQKEAERIRQQQAQQAKQNIDTAFKVFAICCKVMLYMTFAPFLIIVLFCGGFVGGSCGGSRGKKSWF